MSDWLIIRIPFENPNKIEIVDILPSVPIKWQDYLDKIAKREKSPGVTWSQILCIRWEKLFTLQKSGENITRLKRIQETSKELGCC